MSKRTARRSLSYGIIDPDYARAYTIIRRIAWMEGYAIGMHGSFTRDLDLIAVPWADHACEPLHLIKRCAEAANLYYRSEPVTKPHGRLAYMLHLPHFRDPRVIDFSVMPRSIVAGEPDFGARPA